MFRTIYRHCVVTTAVVLLGASTAHACQLVCVQTNATYNGNLGGLAGADAKCAAEFTGFKFARSRSFLANMAGGKLLTVPIIVAPDGANALANPVLQPNIYNGVAVGERISPAFSDNWIHGPANCNDWLNGTTNQGTVTYNDAPCNTALPLLCCNM